MGPSLAVLLTAVVVISRVGTANDICKSARYFYAVLQTEIKCERPCSDYDDPQLLERCMDEGLLEKACSGSTCCLRIHVQTGAANKTSGAKKFYNSVPWDTKYNVNPANYVAGRVDRTQWFYEVKDTVAAHCGKLLITAWDLDPNENWRHFSETTELALNFSSLEPRVYKVKPRVHDRIAFCTDWEGEETSLMIVEAQILIIPFHYVDNDGDKVSNEGTPVPPRSTYGDGKYEYVAKNVVGDKSLASYLVHTIANMSLAENGVLPCRMCLGEQWRVNDDKGKVDPCQGGRLVHKDTTNKVTCTDAIVFAKKNADG